MEEITHYQIAEIKENGVKNDRIQFIPYDRIILDRGMFHFIKERLDDKVKGKKLKRIKTGDILPLNKWDKVFEDIEKEKPIDPIQVRPFKDSKYYEIIDGRHRFIVSLDKEYSHLPCNVHS
uniref:Uncharacterized protein n=1 Tax=viral metagenome TaxID=1070528 RepID=A0A6C0L1T5_9ZZZZ|tara:strand:+ start:4380 stop:4742 length:363 start_codon:yes stop_codon:yes gene_type:complete